MKALLSMTLGLAIAACGSSDNGGSPAAAPTAPVGQQPGTENTPGTGSTPGTPAANEIPYALMVADASGLPPCDAAAANRLVYVKATSEFQVCDGTAWAAIDVKGKDGAPGKDGKDGVDNRIVSTIGCGGQLGTTGIYAYYDAAMMASGDVFVTAKINSDTLSIGTSAFYSVNQNGAQTASVMFVDDLYGASTSGYWVMSLDRATLVQSVEFHDAENTSMPVQSWSMTPDKCTVHKY